MSVVHVKELWDSRDAVDDDDRRRSYVRSFEVRTSSAYDDGTVAGGAEARALGLPGHGEPYPLDSAATVRRINPQQHSDDPTLWTVVLDYSTETSRRQASESQTFNPRTGVSEPTTAGKFAATGQRRQIAENPLDRDPVYRLDFEETTEPVTHTWRDIPILNCANDPYPSLTDEVLRAVMTVEKNYAAVDLEWLENFADSVNNRPWLKRPPRTWKIAGISTAWQMENGVSFARVTFRVKFRGETWDRRLLEQGYRQILDLPLVGPTKVSIQDAVTGAFDHEPSLLDGAFDPLGLTQDTDMPPNLRTPIVEGVRYAPLGYDGTTVIGQKLAVDALPQYTRWRIKKERNWAALGI